MMETQLMTLTAVLQNWPVYWRPALEIAIFWVAYYLLLIYIKDSGMAQALKGVFFLAAIFFVSELLQLTGISWVLSHLFQISILGFLIVFHPEFRRGLTRIGQSPLFKIFIKEEKLVDELVEAVSIMSRRKIGSIIAIEREMSLKSYTDSGIALDGILSTELLLTIFMPATPFHDGGVVIEGGRVAAVACLFPLSQTQSMSKSLGTRHRAALGLSEETDALVVVVSEETGVVSVMNRGKMIRDLDGPKLKAELMELYQPKQGASRSKKWFWKRWSS
jgi:diadenylate cyclase